MNAEAKVKASPNLAGSLVRALAEIEGAAKDKVNPHFKSKYADIASVIDAIKPVLAKHDLGFTQHSQPSEAGVIVETVLHHAGGETLSMGSLYVPANKNDAQGFGSALTYARRYALMTAFGVPAEDDDGNAAAKSAGEIRDPTIPGITKIRNNLNKLRRDGGKATDLEAFNAMVSANAVDLATIRDAGHSLWTGMGEDFDGFKKWIVRRREELTPAEETLGFQMLASALQECATSAELSGLVAKHGDAIDALDDIERRKFETAYDAREAAVLALANVSAG